MKPARKAPGSDSGDTPVLPLVRKGEKQDHPTDAALMDRIRGGDERALEALVDRFWQRLEHFATGIVGSRAQAKDVVQEVFIRAWTRGASSAHPSSVAAYLYTITRNLSLNAKRSERARSRREEVGHESCTSPNKPARPDELLDAALLREEVSAAVASLPDRRREVFKLARFHGLSYHEIAAVLGISSQTVANQMSSALSELKERLSHRLDDAME